MEKRKGEDIKTNSSLLFRREEITTILKQRKKKKKISISHYYSFFLPQSTWKQINSTPTQKSHSQWKA